MKIRTLMTVGLGGAWLLAAPVVRAHDCCGNCGGGDGNCCHMMAGQPYTSGAGQGPASPLYDPDTVTTLHGTVGAVTVVPSRGGQQGGTHVTLVSDGQPTEVVLGPTWFLKGEAVDIVKGDSIEVTGSLLDQAGETFLVARELKKGQKVMTLRDERGVPAWSGGRHR